LVEVSKALINNYKDLNKDNIVGHSDISPDRKEDPGKYFEWSYYLERL
jgi:AmpD protein